MRRVFLGLLSCLVVVATVAQPTWGLGLKIAPLEYKTALKAGERQEGFIDISNPSSQSIAVSVSIQGFKQINDDGGLQFYDDERLSSAIRPELSSITLGAREAVRLAFSIDGNGLPEGDVFAAVMFTTEPTKASSGVGQLVRVGTLLSIVNKTPGERSALVTAFDMPFIQFDDMANGNYKIKNVGRKEQGFYPTVTVSSWPSGVSKEVQSSLVFGGRERQNDISYRAGFGIHRIDVAFGESTRSQWVVLMRPWVIVVMLLGVLIVGVELFLLRRRRKAKT